MTTLTIKINEKSKKGKAFLELARAFFDDSKEIEIIDDSNYNKDFVKMVKQAHESKNRTKVTSKNLWENI